MRASRMEVNGGDPVTMTLSSHDVLLRLHIPDLPCAVIRGSSDDLLPLVERHTTDTSCMGLDLVCSSQARRNLLVSLSEEGIRARVLWHARVLGGTFAQSALTEKLGLILGGVRAH